MVRDDTDLDGLPREERGERLRIRNEIAAGVAHIGEGASARVFRERTEAIEAKKKRLDTRPQNDLVTWPKLAIEIEAYIQEYDDDLHAQLVTAIVGVRRESRKLIAEAIGPLKAELETLRAEIAALKEQVVTAPGKLPIAKAWQAESVVYAGAFVSHQNSAWQATRDTAKRPGDDDWVLIARAGRDGKDGASLSVRGEWDECDSYAMLDLVIHNDVSYFATRNDPGRPGDGKGGWQVIAAKGEKGDRGERGPRGSKGEKGVAGAEIESWALDEQRYRLWPRMANGGSGRFLN